MWGFLNNLLEKAGVVAALFALTLLGVGFAARWAWKQYGLALDRVAEVQKTEEKKRGEMRVAFEVEKSAMREEHATELLAVAEQRRVEADKFGHTLGTVRDLHTEQMVALVEKSTRHIERIDQSVAKLGAGLDVLIRIGDGGR